jgi:hypothetical protein
MKCDCAYFWSGNGHCSHIVAVYHRIGIINIIDMMSKLAPVRKRDLGNVNPARWRKQDDIAYPEYLIGVVYDHRTKENDGVTVWKVRFRNAPGGMQDFEMEEEASLDGSHQALRHAERNGMQDHDQRRLVWLTS